MRTQGLARRRGLTCAEVLIVIVLSLVLLLVSLAVLVALRDRYLRLD